MVKYSLTSSSGIEEDDEDDDLQHLKRRQHLVHPLESLRRYTTNSKSDKLITTQTETNTAKPAADDGKSAFIVFVSLLMNCAVLCQQ